MKINCQRKMNECFLLTPRMGIETCVVMIPSWLSRGYSVSSRLYIKLSFTSSPYSTVLRSVFDGNCQNHSISIIILLSNQVKHHYDGHMIFFGSLKTTILLTMQEKTDFFFNYKTCNSLSSWKS